MAVIHRVSKSFLALSLLFGACSGATGKRTPEFVPLTQMILGI
jgi:hypothetical protein